jgi:hypothetical protein
MKKSINVKDMTDEEFDKLFEESRQAIIAKRRALTPEERERIDSNPTFERWDGEIEPTKEGEDE